MYKKFLVNLVDKKGKRVGMAEKLEAHKQGWLHEAFSIFIFNAREELLLQRRAAGKYHSCGLWSNTVCSHPAYLEDLTHSAARRLQEEMGFSTPIKEIFSFVYKSKYQNGLVEYELDHIFAGKFGGQPEPDPREVMDYKWIKIPDLLADIREHSNKYTTWFRKIIKREEFEEYLKTKKII
jgi:isopentenyl-diphosphate Delta-isomerase